MTPRELLDAFETLADAPHGVRCLRDLILQLAMWGRLVPQGPELVHSAVESIRAKRIKAGTLKADLDDGFGNLAREEWPFEPPPSWRMIRFGDVFLDVFTGPFGTALKAHEYVRGGTPIVNPQHLRDGCIIPTEDACVGPLTLKRLHTFLLRERDVVVARRGEMGRCAVVDENAEGWLCGTGSLVLRPPSELLSRFVTIYLSSPWTVERLGGDSVGSTMKNLNQRILAGLPFGLPPLEEQHRIVARVDELMGLLDRLEAANTVRNDVRRAARDAALAALRDAEDTGAFEVAWARISGQMDVLFNTPDDVASLRQAVLQVAVRGRLAPQDRTEEPASRLLNRLGANRSRRRGEAELQADSEPFELPPGWVWATVADVGRDGADSVADGPFGSKLKSEHYTESPGFRVVRLGNIGKGVFKSGDETYIPREYFAALEKYHLEMGDIIVASLGDPPGRACIVPASVLPAINKADCFRVRPHVEIHARYVVIVLNSPFGSARSIALHRGDTRGRINLSHLRSAPLPLPPVAEQQRIVAKVDFLMALCDDLEAQLTVARELQAKFAAAAVHHLDV